MDKKYQYTKGFVKSFLPIALIGVISNASAYELIDLGANVAPNAINNFGVVAGSSNTDQFPSTAFRWSSDSGIEIIKGGTVANAINDNDQIVGNTVDGAFILDGNYRDWSDYGAFGNNQLGEVAGYSVGKNPFQPRSLPYNPAIYDGKKWNVYDIAKLYSRGTREGVYADRFILNAINDSGYSVGYKYRYGLAGYSAILIDPNVTINDLSDVVYLSAGRAADINNHNMVVGTTSGDYTHAFLYDYDNDTTIDLGTLPINDTEDALTSAAYDINDLDQVVGQSRLITDNTSLNDPTKYHAFIWQDGQMDDLNNLASLPDGWLLTRANSINENGDIAGVGLYNGVEHGFVLTNGTITEPPPEQNQAPVAIASADVYSGRAPLTVNFDGSASDDPDGTIETYAWDFMDGSSSSEVSPSHTFTNTGTYTVTLTITDNLGMASSNSISITARKGGKK